MTYGPEYDAEIPIFSACSNLIAHSSVQKDLNSVTMSAELSILNGGA
jgi:hypothetical protein